MIFTAANPAHSKSRWQKKRGSAAALPHSNLTFRLYVSDLGGACRRLTGRLAKWRLPTWLERGGPL